MEHNATNAMQAIRDLVSSHGGEISFESPRHWDYQFTDSGVELTQALSAIRLVDDNLEADFVEWPAEADYSPSYAKTYTDILYDGWNAAEHFITALKEEHIVKAENDAQTLDELVRRASPGVDIPKPTNKRTATMKDYERRELDNIATQTDSLFRDAVTSCDVMLVIRPEGEPFPGWINDIKDLSQKVVCVYEDTPMEQITADVRAITKLDPLLVGPMILGVYSSKTTFDAEKRATFPGQVLHDLQSHGMEVGTLICTAHSQEQDDLSFAKAAVSMMIPTTLAQPTSPGIVPADKCRELIASDATLGINDLLHLRTDRVASFELAPQYLPKVGIDFEKAITKALGEGHTLRFYSAFDAIECMRGIMELSMLKDNPIDNQKANGIIGLINDVQMGNIPWNEVREAFDSLVSKDRLTTSLWDGIKGDVAKSVLMDCLTQNAEYLSDLLQTGIKRFDVSEEQATNPWRQENCEYLDCLQEVRSDLRILLSSQTNLNRQVIVARSAGEEREYNVMDERGRFLSPDTWFRSIKEEHDGNSYTCELANGSKVEISHCQTPDDIREKVARAEDNARKQEIMHSGRTFGMR